jgi:hypothetical protein
MRQAEMTAAKRMLKRCEDRRGLYPASLAADTAYGSAEMLGWLVEEKAIAPHIPVFQTGRRQDGTVSRRDFPYDPDEDCYICPDGKALKQYRHAGRAAKAKSPKDGFLRYRAQKADCDVCALKPRCTPKEPMRKVLRSVREEARDLARRIAKTEAYA